MGALFKSTALAAALLLSASITWAEPIEVTFQNGAGDPFSTSTYQGTQDTYLNGNARDANNGESSNMIGSNARKELLLIRFDLGSMRHQNARIVSADLYLKQRTQSTHPTPSQVTMNAYALDAADGDWTDASTGGATWNNKSYVGAGSSSNIAWAGGAGLGVDSSKPADSSTWGFGPNAVASATYDFEKGNQYIRFSLPASLVQQWLDGDNPGLVITSTIDSSDPVTLFYSSDIGSTSYRPKLVVTYSVPEPASGSLMLLAGGSLLTGRRRKDKK